MNNRAILYIYFIAHSYAVNITSYYSIEPDAAIFSCDHITNNCCVWSNKTIFSKLRANALNWKNYWHKLLFYLVVKFLHNLWIPGDYFFSMLPRPRTHR